VRHAEEECSIDTSILQGMARIWVGADINCCPLSRVECPSQGGSDFIMSLHRLSETAHQFKYLGGRDAFFQSAHPAIRISRRRISSSMPVTSVHGVPSAYPGSVLLYQIDDGQPFSCSGLNIKTVLPNTSVTHTDQDRLSRSTNLWTNTHTSA